MIEAIFPIETARAWGEAIRTLGVALGRPVVSEESSEQFQAKYLRTPVIWYDPDDESTFGGGPGHFSDGIIRGWR